ncbi:hypothetical protein K461DRAFT_68966 [Myriangium duriaei CBS 260.36]|uniref:Uncharacterized protein n=1 Tax=Myriangium duriaei CBS 260.36 TaxID=1168546 RepID=A0A9P4MBY9_9PEZI|nr:hypothetical protein K461DRAFT_68966 [Myriangium duriaei CBS 260.36]
MEPILAHGLRRRVPKTSPVEKHFRPTPTRNGASARVLRSRVPKSSSNVMRLSGTRPLVLKYFQGVLDKANKCRSRISDVLQDCFQGAAYWSSKFPSSVTSPSMSNSTTLLLVLPCPLSIKSSARTLGDIHISCPSPRKQKLDLASLHCLGFPSPCRDRRMVPADRLQQYPVA